ncbi:Rieske 2Fe-2S domain-containing protein [Bradyrhizobium sp. LHD-71]|uniref:Rieske (2Fe-2S) protein n=1 Tax=Bradyrhizobium sp. LHD-71 TaxID=3072141 RepID=UPI00280DC031|nr:Rieske 2Fe-2S domain-containing protein [Bradyrhizobium sp. LHD-71]MDQ8727407.1 Rieske 2Fe-2S domain-containing protein [Bradyrhizobium sp. LHD-71]
MAKYVVALASQIPPGQCKIVSAAGREIGVYNIDNAFYALVNRCPHEGAAVCRGDIVGRPDSDMPGTYRLIQRGEMVRCPWHGWLFEIKTGQSWCDSATRARSIPVVVETGEALTRGLFQAETVPVTVEDRYIVLEF